jgi:hypothetical protein
VSMNSRAFPIGGIYTESSSDRSLRNTWRNNAGVLRGTRCTHGYSEVLTVLTGTQRHTKISDQALTSTFVPPLQGEGLGFEPLSAH